MRRDEPRHVTEELVGPWSQGVDVAGTDIRTQGLLQTPTRTELLKVWNNTEPASAEQPELRGLAGRRQDHAGQSCDETCLGRRAGHCDHQRLVPAESSAGESRAPQARRSLDSRVLPGAQSRLPGKRARGARPCRTPRATRPRRNPRDDASCWLRTGSCWAWCIASAYTRFLADPSHSRTTPRRSSASTLRRSGNCWSAPRMNRSPEDRSNITPRSIDVTQVSPSRPTHRTDGTGLVHRTTSSKYLHRSRIPIHEQRTFGSFRRRQGGRSRLP